MKKILIVEGNLKEENQQFTNAGIQTHTESLKDSIAYFTKNLEIDIANPSSDPKVFEHIKNLDEYDGLIWGGSSLNIYNDTIEIRRQIDFMKASQKKNKKNSCNLLGYASCSNCGWRRSKKKSKRNK